MPRPPVALVRISVGLAILLASHPVPPAAARAQDNPPASPSVKLSRIEALNAAFLDHVRAMPQHARAANVLSTSLDQDYTGEKADGFVPDGLAVVYPAFRDVMAAFDAEKYADASDAAAKLPVEQDPFLAANTTYFAARSLVERGLLDEAGRYLDKLVTPEARLDAYTPYAGHLWFIKGFAHASDLRFDDAKSALHVVLEQFPDAPEAILTGATQLLIEIERREIGTLDEVAGLMTYVGGRLKVADGGERVREREKQALDLLDKLIKENEDKEKQGQCSGGSKSGKKSSARRRPAKPAEKSEIAPGPGAVGDLHDPGKADPGEMWGKLPPAERERILQSLRSRFPSRYKELVEQYYRNLAQEK